MHTVVDSVYAQFRETSKFLEASGELSLYISLDAYARKVLLLSSASYFEGRLTDAVRSFTRHAANGDPLIVSLIESKAITRQYHAWFDWNADNANRFFGLFGNEFREHMKSEIKGDPILSDAISSFMELGRLRNALVHTNFGAFVVDKTSDEVYSLYRLAFLFVNRVSEDLVKCSNAVRERLVSVGT